MTDRIIPTAHPQFESQSSHVMIMLYADLGDVSPIGFQVVSTPAVACSAFQISAYKKLVIVQLIKDGKVRKGISFCHSFLLGPRLRWIFATQTDLTFPSFPVAVILCLFIFTLIHTHTHIHINEFAMTQTSSLPKYVSAAVTRAIKHHCSIYKSLADAFSLERKGARAVTISNSDRELFIKVRVFFFFFEGGYKPNSLSKLMTEAIGVS